MINQERIKNLLLELVQIDSHSRKERDVAERIKKHCEAMGAEVEIDDAGEKVGGNSGNVIARFPGTIPGAGLPGAVEGEVTAVRGSNSVAVVFDAWAGQGEFGNASGAIATMIRETTIP